MLVSTLIVFLLQMVVTVALGVLLYDARGAESWVALVPVLLLGAAAFAGLGFGARGADPLGRGRLGGGQPRRPADGVPLRLVRPDGDYPDVLQAIADVLPLTYLIGLIEAAYLHGESLTSDLGAVAVLVAWGVAGYAVAARRFDWQPRER